MTTIRPAMPATTPMLITAKLAAPVSAALLGAVFIFGVGFINIQAIHDAAHDVRHVLSFPCH